MKLVGYIRVSRVGDRSGASFISPAIQAEQIAAKARLGGHVLIGEPIVDLDESGGNLARPGWEQAVAEVMAGEADGVIVAKLDRFSRNLRDALNVIEEFERAGKVLISAAEDFDPTTPMGRFARDIVIRLAQMERERLAEGWRQARGRAVSAGIFAARAPFGYRRTPKDEGRRLEPDPKAAPIVRELFERRAAGETWFVLCKWLDEVAPRQDGGAWPQSTVARMVGKRTYIGEGEAGQRHEPIVPRALFEAAQRSPAVGRYAPNPRLLTGLVRCASCGGLMTRTTDGRGYEVYRCRGRRAAGVCPKRARVSVALADEHVERAFLTLDSLRLIKWRGGEPLPIIDEGAVMRLELAEAERDAYRDESLVSIIGREAFAAGLAQRQRAVDDARDAVRAQGRPGEDFATLWARSAGEAYWADRAEDWTGKTIDEKRKLLAEYVEAVIVQPGHAADDGRSGRSTIPLSERLAIQWAS